MDDTSRHVEAEQARGNGATEAVAATSDINDGSDPTIRHAGRGSERHAVASEDEDQEDRAVAARTSRIRRDIEQTRGEMSETIEAIEEKLRPGRLVAEATERVKSAATDKVRDMADTASDTAQDVIEYTREAADTVASTVQQNPIPTAMIAIGAAWWLINQAQSRQVRTVNYRSPSRPAQAAGRTGASARKATDRTASSGYRQSPVREDRGMIDLVISNPIPAAMATAGLTWLALSRFDNGGVPATQINRSSWPGSDRAARIGQRGEKGPIATAAESAEQLADRTQAYAANIASQAEEYAGDMTEVVRDTGRQVQNQVQRLMNTNPFVVGVGALALGAAIGYMAPETESENEWMGDARETVLDGVQDLARTAASRVQDAAGDMVGEVASRIISGDKP